MSIYMKSFAVFVICASSVAMVAAAPPVEMSDEAGNIYLNQDMPKAADLPASIIDSPLANNSANYHSSDYDATALSCMGQVDATTYSPSSMSLLAIRRKSRYVDAGAAGAPNARNLR